MKRGPVLSYAQPPPAAVQPLAAEDPAIAEILAFIGDGKHRALCLPAKGSNES